IPRLAGQPRVRHGAGRETALAAADVAYDPRWRWSSVHEGSVPGWAEAAAGGSRMCVAGGLRKSCESDAGARIEGSRADLGTCGARRFAAAAGAEGAGGVFAAGCDWRSFRH